jgi:FAD dependent oxidoreductase TIGR03364
VADRYDIGIVGAGILGLAHAYTFAKRGFKVVVLERNPRALGASVRNFGMIWPVGQPLGAMRDLAMRSRDIWVGVTSEAGIWRRDCGSLHLAYHKDELGVLDEFSKLAPDAVQMLTAAEACDRSPVVRRSGLLGAMASPSELCVNPREVVRTLPGHLGSLGVEFRFGASVVGAEPGKLFTAESEILADQIFLCTGDDFETLYPAVLRSSGLNRCKLQMLKARASTADYSIGPHLCAGLTLGHYSNFRVCKRLPELLARFERELPEHVRCGVHLLVSQHENGDLTIGDSHEYGLSPDPFLREEIDRLILGYLDTFLPTEHLRVSERWYGVYAKHPEKSYVVEEVAPGVVLVTGVGGAGMTLSFGLADLVANRFG